jgi:nitrate reductase delta subunit
MTLTFKALSLLLSYPTAELKEAAGEIEAALRREALLPARSLARLGRLLDDFKSLDLYELQERYVLLFDRTRSLSLHLFEHVHGESRDRGQAMADLKSLYAAQGLEIDARELPDFLPLFLEFLSQRPIAEARSLLAETAAVIAALKERLARRRSVYAAAFHALEAIADGRADEKELEALRRAPDEDADDLDALDRAWDDAPVTFGPGAASCPQAERMVERMTRPDESGRNTGA